MEAEEVKRAGDWSNKKKGVARIEILVSLACEGRPKDSRGVLSRRDVLKEDVKSERPEPD